MALFQRFKKAPIEKTGVEISVSEQSLIYRNGDFDKYNPDDLIGRKGHKIYKRMMQDEQVKAVVKFKRDAISARGWTFKPDEDLSETETDFRVALFEHIISEMRGSFLDVANGVLSAFYNGFSLSEIVTNKLEFEGRTWIGLEKVKLKPFDTFVFDVDEYGNIRTAKQDVNGSRIPLDIDKFIYFVVNPDIDEHYGSSELREAYRAWFSKDVAIKFRNIWNERYAGGFRTAQPEKGHTITPQEKSQIDALLSNINLTSSIQIPAWLNLETEYPNGNGHDAFKKTIDDSDMQIARALLVPPLLGVSPQGDVGSYSQSSTQLEAFFWTLEADTKRLEECLNEQLFRPLGEVNFPDGNYPRFSFNPLSREKAVEIIKLFIELVNSKVLTTSEEDQKYIREVLELPSVIVEPEEDPVDPEDEPMEDNTEEKEEEDIVDDEPDIEEERRRRRAVYEEETILGVGLLKNAIKKASSRVAFAVIEKTSDAAIEESVVGITTITDSIAKDLVQKGREGGSLEDDISENVRNIKLDSKLRQRLRTQVDRSLRSGEAIGLRNAEDEINKAKGKFSANINRIKLIAGDYFKTTGFKITGDISDAMAKIVEQQILNGARSGKPYEEVEQDIYRELSSQGYISQSLAKESLGALLNTENPDARIRTIVKTSTFDAINNARHSYFTDPELGDFVRAFEYSSILDGRTTEICRHLDSGAGDHSKEWYERNGGFRPPNHFNCRSLLIPVTMVDMDEFVEGPEPTIFPQQGFG